MVDVKASFETLITSSSFNCNNYITYTDYREINENIEDIYISTGSTSTLGYDLEYSFNWGDGTSG
jgi:hypothetical protein